MFNASAVPDLLSSDNDIEHKPIMFKDNMSLFAFLTHI